MSVIKLPMQERQRVNTTTPARELGDFITPHEKIFVVYHMGVPAVAGQAWSLSIGGLVERPTVLTLADLASLPTVEVCATHECAGSPLRPTVPVRRVGNVVWRGVRLKTVLDMVGVKPEARFLWARGADSGIYPPTGVDNDCYLKDIPIDKAGDDDVLLATELNGEPLSVVHGAPLRLAVPGYYGTNSVKWLTELRLESTRAAGYFTAVLYNDRTVENGVERMTPVWELAPNSIIVAPADEAIHAGDTVRIWGWAWSARSIKEVQVSTNGGADWNPARLAQGESRAWQRFWIDWTPACAGVHELISRAADDAGNSQPATASRSETFKMKVDVLARPVP